MTTRKPAVAGSFYPAEKSELRKMIDYFLKNAIDTDIEGKLKGLVVPHAGYIYSGSVAGVGYKLLKESAPHTKYAILIGPSHHEKFYGVAQTTEEYWETPLGNIRVEQLSQTDVIQNNAKPHAVEHCLEVQVPFIQTVIPNADIYAFLTGEVSSSVFATQLSMNMPAEDTIIIASSDLSHYQPYLQAQRIDSVANKAVPSLDIEKAESFIDACGKDAILTLMKIAKKYRWTGKFLEYKNSGDTAGPKDAVVGYGCYAFYSSD